ncbi:MAG: hypothetical protein RLZZ187_944 [Pseudomonadota bacterium]|jgi:hypothetical protein
MAKPPLTRQNGFRIDSAAADHAAAGVDTHRVGGDFRALFKNSMVVFKPHDAARAVTAARELKEKMPKIDINFWNFNFKLGLPDFLQDIREFFEQIRRALREFKDAILQPFRAAINAVKEYFRKILEHWEELKKWISEAFKGLFDFLPEFNFPDIFAFFDFLFDFIPDMVMNFIEGLMEAITPFIGSAVACGKMLMGWKSVTSAALQRLDVKEALPRLDTTNRFNEAAGTAFMVQVNRSLRRTAEGAALATGNAALSVSGFFTFGVSSTVGGIAMTIAKLAIHIGYAMKDFREAHLANKKLWSLRGVPVDRINPADLYNGSPILAAYYIQAASHTTLLSIDMTQRGWQDKAAAAAKKISPLRKSAAKLIGGSRLGLIRMDSLPSPYEIFARAKTVSGAIAGAQSVYSNYSLYSEALGSSA